MAPSTQARQTSHYSLQDRSLPVRKKNRPAGIPIRSDCAGNGTCGKCKLQITRGPLRPPTRQERKLLSPDELARGFRLACQTELLDEHELRLPAASRPAEPLLHLQYAAGPADRPAIQQAASLGMAVDLGTTTIAAYLVSLDDGTVLRSASMLNPQYPYGIDVMSRILHARNEEGKSELRSAVVGALNTLTRHFHPLGHKIRAMTITGNTTMHHLLLGLPVKQLGLYPYEPALKDMHTICAGELGLAIAADTPVYMLPNVGGFIGSDHVAMILATGIHTTPKTVLGIDIGTNTEIVLAHRGTLTSTSCASGPALEGGHIAHGMLAAKGAISKVTITETMVNVQTIDGSAPAGLCGSGVLDAVAGLVGNGLLDKKGRLGSDPRVVGSGAAAEFIIVSAAKSATGQDITVSQQDIQEIQLAKAAIRTGLEILLAESKITWQDVDEVVLAGGFGSCIDVASAVTLGMFPPLQHKTYRQVGNASGKGARLSLLSEPARHRACEIAGMISYYDLAAHPRFSRTFACHLRF